MADGFHDEVGCAIIIAAQEQRILPTRTGLRPHGMLAAFLVGLGGAVEAEPPNPLPTCGTVAACIARARHVADQSGGITPPEDEVANALQALSPEAIDPVLQLLQDPNENVRELAGYILRDMPGLRPEHLDALERAVEGGDGWLPPAIASIGTPRATRFLVDQLKKKPVGGGPVVATRPDCSGTDGRPARPAGRRALPEGLLSSPEDSVARAGCPSD